MEEYEQFSFFFIPILINKITINKIVPLSIYIKMKLPFSLLLTYAPKKPRNKEFTFKSKKKQFSAI